MFRSLAILAASLLSTGARSADKPSWFGQDYRSPSGWGFFCSGEAKTEAEALKSAQAQCSAKMCQLFGVEVDYASTSRETLKDASVETVIIEKCPKVRVVGRKEKKKVVSCEDELCTAFVEQLYPKREYDLEYARLNKPSIVEEFSQTIVVRENDKTFRDPALCRTALKAYSLVRGERSEDAARRAAALEQAGAECRELDYRDVPLQSELIAYVTTTLALRPSAVAMKIGKLLLQESKIEERLKKLLAIEKALASSEKAGAELKAWIKARYDWLAPRDNYDGTIALYRLSGGASAKTDPYLDELATCETSKALLLKWPAHFLSDLNVCVPQMRDASANDCQNFNNVTVRYGYVGCICRAAKHDNVSLCTSSLVGYLDETCPDGVSPECFASFGRFAAEQMKMRGL